MKYLSFLLLCIITGLTSQAKIWRLNNNPGVEADFTTFSDVVQSTLVANGDTIHIEPSLTTYATSGNDLNKRLIIIGAGYFLDPANTNTPGNAGLQFTKMESRLEFLRFGVLAAGTKLIGLTMQGSAFLNGAVNISFEKVLFVNGLYFEDGTNNNISVRKCFFNGSNITSSGTAVVTNFISENSIFYNNAYVSVSTFSGPGNLFRNNSIASNANGFVLTNTYIANNIFGTAASGTFTNCTIKNNLFQTNQELPGTATGNQLNVDMETVYTSGTTGSLDSRIVLRANSPAIAAGLTVGAVVSPDCGAFGATDPYRLSGIPPVPSIYALTVPVSIPSGSNSMNITFSSKNNN